VIKNQIYKGCTDYFFSFIVSIVVDFMARSFAIKYNSGRTLFTCSMRQRKKNRAKYTLDSKAKISLNSKSTLMV